MSEGKNTNSSRRRERREQGLRNRTDQRNFNRRQREEKMARMSACQDRKFHDEDFHKGREWFGIFIIIIGLVWLSKAFLVTYPAWLYSWQMAVIGIGLAIGLSSRFRNKIAFIMILIGLAFLLRDYIFPEQNLRPYIWPLVVIAIGVIFLLKKRAEDRFRTFAKEHPEEVKDWRHYWHGELSDSDSSSRDQKRSYSDATNTSNEESNNRDSGQTGTKFERHSRDRSRESIVDWLDVTTVFSGTKRNVWSKNFKGGEIISIFGGSDIDLSRADISGSVTINMTVIMGGVRLAVPTNWQLKFNDNCIMGGTDDRRMNNNEQDPNKTLIITGTILMGGLEVRDIF